MTTANPDTPAADDAGDEAAEYRDANGRHFAIVVDGSKKLGEVIKEARDANTGGTLDQKFADIFNEMALHQRQQNLARAYITDRHVASVRSRIYWRGFVEAQRLRLVDDPWIDEFRQAVCPTKPTPASEALRGAIARELLHGAWASAALKLGFDEDQTDVSPEDVLEFMFTGDHAGGAPHHFTARDLFAVSTQPLGRTLLEGFWADYLQSTRAAIPEPDMRAVVSDDGTMLIPSTGLILETWRGLNLGARAFADDASGYPTQRLRQKRNVNASLTMMADSLPAAWDRVKSLGKGSPEVFIGLVAHFMRDRSHPALWGSYDGYVSRDALTDFRGVKKHNRAYRADDSRDTVEAVEALRGLYINGSHKVWMSAKEGGKRRPVDMLIRGQAFTLDIIPRTGTPEEREAFLASGPGWGSDIVPENIAGWAYKFGPWADCLRKGTPQFAKMLEAVTNYSAVQGLYARRLGFVLTMAFRIQAHERNWSQPHLIGDLLDDAGIEPEKNRARVIERFAAALQELNRDGVIANATYADGSSISVTPPEHLGKYWYEPWLALGMIVTPPGAIKSEYHAIGQNSPKVAAGIAKTQRKGASRTVKMPPKV